VILATGRDALAEALGEVHRKGLVLGLVPTMGFLHDGHLSLVDLARERSDYLAVSVFVNPLQFGPGEDLDRYPRDLERDLHLLRSRGADLVFAPSTEVMYPSGEPVVTVDPGPGGQLLCGAFRPGHFRGVLTVVARLFGLFRPGFACFGQKDYQQAVLIRRMVWDLEMGTEIVMGPIVRDQDGLAMSSRNVFLSAEERAQAVFLSRALAAVGSAFRDGVREVDALKGVLLDVLKDHPLLRLQYAEVVHPDTLEGLTRATPGAVAAVAAHCGETRLIDNWVLQP